MKFTQLKRRSEAFGLPGVDTSQTPEFTRRDFKRVERAANNLAPLPIDVIDQELEYDTTPRDSTRARNITTGMSVALGASAFGVEIALNEDPDLAAAGGPLHHAAQGVVDAVHIFGLGDAYQPDATGMVGNWPMVGLTAAVGVGAVAGIVGYGRTTRLRRYDRVQSDIRNAVEAGIQAYDLSDDQAGVAFVGYGSALASEVAKHRRTVQIAYERVPDSIYVHLDTDTTADQARKAYDRADVRHAEDVSVYTAATGYALFPPVAPDRRADHYSVDRLTTMAERIHDIWAEPDANGMAVEPRSVRVFANENQVTISASATAAGKPRPTSRHPVTMRDRVDQLRHRYGDHFELYDPSRLVFEAAVEIADDQPFELWSDDIGLARFLPRFNQLADERRELERVDMSAEPCRVICYPFDRSAVAFLSQNSEPRDTDIVLQREPSRRHDLETLGIEPERIIVASDELQRHAWPEASDFNGGTADQLR